MKACRLFLLSAKTLDGSEISLEYDNHMTLAWLNSMRADLSALGLARRIKDVSPDLATILREHAEAAKAAEQPTNDMPADLVSRDDADSPWQVEAAE